MCELLPQTGGGAVIFIPFGYTANKTEEIHDLLLRIYVREPCLKIRISFTLYTCSILF